MLLFDLLCMATRQLSFLLHWKTALPFPVISRLKKGHSELVVAFSLGKKDILPHRQIKYPVDFDDELKTRKRQIRKNDLNNN